MCCKFIIMVLTGCVALSCVRNESDNLSQGARVRVVAEVLQLFDDYYAAVRDSGLTAEFDYLDHSEDFFWIPPGYTDPISYDSVEAVLLLNAGRYVSIDNAIDTIRVEPLTAGAARYVAKLRSVMKDTSGQIIAIQLLESGVVVKRKEGWKLLSGQTLLINP